MGIQDDVENEIVETKLKIKSTMIALLLCSVAHLGSAQQPRQNFTAPPVHRLAQQQNQMDSQLPPARLVPTTPAAHPVRIKDITTIAGHRSHHLSGLGLVTGLAGTGSTSPLTQRLYRNLLQRMGLNFNEQLATKNAAVVTVSADVPPFTQPGEKFDVAVSAFDDSSSLYGGKLEFTMLTAYDDQPYAIAWGSVNPSGFSAGGAGASVQKKPRDCGIRNGSIGGAALHRANFS